MQRKDRQRKREAKRAKRKQQAKSARKARNTTLLGMSREERTARFFTPRNAGSQISRALADGGMADAVSKTSLSRFRPDTSRSVVSQVDGGVTVEIAGVDPAESAKTLTELKALAKSRGVKGYSKFKSAQIEELRSLVKEARA